jgi:hypothetical protein
VSQDNNEEQIKELEIFNLNKTSSTFFYLLWTYNFVLPV